MKVSCVMTTYRRFTCVERSISMFLAQDYEGEIELIVYNTDTEFPLVPDNFLQSCGNIKIINNNTNYVTGTPYNNIGDIRRDALQHATGEYYICWDDDDIYLPWNITQCVDGINSYSDIWAWKPQRSIWWSSEDKLEIAGNAMEASIISKIEYIKKYGFTPHLGGGEHWSWLQKFFDYKKIIQDDNSVPGYCFNWSDQGIIRGHKQSGTFDHPNNFEIHKEHTRDYATRKLQVMPQEQITKIYKRVILFLKDNIDKNINDYVLTKDNYEKYIKQYE